MDKSLLKKPRIKFWIATPTIIISLILFYPLGLLLTYLRARIDKNAAKLISLILFIFTASSEFIIYMALKSGNNSLESFDYFLMIFIAILPVSIAIYTRAHAILFLKYIELIVDEEYSSIDDIAKALSTTYDIAKFNIEKLMRDGYLTGCRINESTREILLPNRSPKAVTNEDCSSMDNIAETVAVAFDYINETLNTWNVPGAVNEPRVVECERCGALNKLTAEKGSCEYCRSPLKA